VFLKKSDDEIASSLIVPQRHFFQREFAVAVGRSSRDLRLHTAVTVA